MGAVGNGVRLQSTGRLGTVLAAMVLVLAQSASAQPATGQGLQTPGAPASIGAAAMLADGTIVLHLRAAGQGAIGDALLRYPPSHPAYQAIRTHLPGLEPGKSVPVPPFE